MANERSLYWDTLKGFLIILVVFGHCGTAVGDNLLSVIYAFHMPLFIFISGYFSKKTEYINFKSYKRLFYLFLIFDFIYLGLDLFTTGVTIRRILTPSFALWYIWCLILWRLVLQCLPQKILNKQWLVLSISLIICIAVGFIPINKELSFQRAFTFWPFFIAGYYIRQANLINKIRNINKPIIVIAFVFLCIIAYLFIPVMYSNHSYVKLPQDINTRLIHIVIASCMCFSLLIIGQEKIPIFTTLGQYTLLIYLLHPPIIKILKVLCTKIGYKPDIIAAILITLITITLIYSIRNIKILRFLK